MKEQPSPNTSQGVCRDHVIPSTLRAKMELSRLNTFLINVADDMTLNQGGIMSIRVIYSLPNHVLKFQVPLEYVLPSLFNNPPSLQFDLSPAVYC
ncbi:hypothetical protein CEXT_230951 [Caerostris extrusa]|uniref:Uncharacterized protein n=1 Tax=Caerostris extrusa TaxID=172846 RepID=A0AAV4NCN5_CAEEX|nr:hypothetical protein CEXT_230951 [Caerostris extrusa]